MSTKGRTTRQRGVEPEGVRGGCEAGEGRGWNSTSPSVEANAEKVSPGTKALRPTPGGRLKNPSHNVARKPSHTCKELHFCKQRERERVPLDFRSLSHAVWTHIEIQKQSRHRRPMFSAHCWKPQPHHARPLHAGEGLFPRIPEINFHSTSQDGTVRRGNHPPGPLVQVLSLLN